MAKPWFVYIALLEDGRFYVGMTRSSVEARILEHIRGRGNAFTRRVPVIKKLWSEKHSSGSSARKREMQLKRWTHAKKRALIEGDLELLKTLSRPHL